MHTLLHWLPVWCTNPAKTFAKAHIYSIYAYNTYKQALEAYTHTHTFSYCCTCAPSNPCKICCKCSKHTHTQHTLQVWNHLLENCTPTAYSMQICDRQAYRPPQSYDVPARLQCSKNFAAFAHSSTHHSRSREGARLHATAPLRSGSAPLRPLKKVELFKWCEISSNEFTLCLHRLTKPLHK